MAGSRRDMPRFNRDRTGWSAVSPMARRIGAWLLGVAAAVLFLCTVPGWLLDVDLGQFWSSETAFLKRQRDLGYRVYGRIEGPMRWPAIAYGRVDGGDLGSIEFTAPSGQKHIYPNFTDVRFKAVTFQPLGKRLLDRERPKPFVIVLGRKESAE